MEDPSGRLREKPDRQTIVKTYYVGDLIFPPPSTEVRPDAIEEAFPGIRCRRSWRNVNTPICHSSST